MGGSDWICQRRRPPARHGTHHVDAADDLYSLRRRGGPVFRAARPDAVILPEVQQAVPGHFCILSAMRDRIIPCLSCLQARRGTYMASMRLLRKGTREDRRSYGAILIAACRSPIIQSVKSVLQTRILLLFQQAFIRACLSREVGLKLKNMCGRVSRPVRISSLRIARAGRLWRAVPTCSIEAIRFCLAAAPAALWNPWRFFRLFCGR